MLAICYNLVLNIFLGLALSLGLILKMGLVLGLGLSLNLGLGLSPGSDSRQSFIRKSLHLKRPYI